MWLQQAKSIIQEEEDIPDKTKKVEEKDALPTIRMVLAMMFLKSFVEMVIVDPEDLDCADTGAIGQTLSMLATVIAKMKTTDLLR